MENKHTPGPWYLSPKKIYVRAEGVHGWNICTIEDQPPYTEANAELIASAPQLAEQVKQLQEENKKLVAALADIYNEIPKDPNANYATILVNKIKEKILELDIPKKA